MTKSIGAVGLFLLACLPTIAQDKRAEAFFGYSYARINPNTLGQPSFNLNGGSTSLAYKVTGFLALVSDAHGFPIASTLGSLPLGTSLSEPFPPLSAWRRRVPLWAAEWEALP